MSTHSCTAGGLGKRISDEFADLLRNVRPAGLTVAAQPRPMLAKFPSLPPNDGRRLNDDQGALPAGPGLEEPRPEDPVCGLKPRAFHGPLTDGEWVPERQDLDLHFRTGPEERHDRRRHGLEPASDAGGR